MTKLYFKRRYNYGSHWTNRYTPSYIYNKMFSDYIEDWTVTMVDGPIPEDYYLTIRRIGYCEFDETKISKEELTYDLRDLPNHIRVYTDNNEAEQFLLDYTDQRKMPQQDDGSFLIRKAYTDEMTWEEIGAKYFKI